MNFFKITFLKCQGSLSLSPSLSFNPSLLQRHIHTLLQANTHKTLASNLSLSLSLSISNSLSLSLPFQLAACYKLNPNRQFRGMFLRTAQLAKMLTIQLSLLKNSLFLNYQTPKVFVIKKKVVVNQRVNKKLFSIQLLRYNATIHIFLS